MYPNRDKDVERTLTVVPVMGDRHHVTMTTTSSSGKAALPMLLKVLEIIFAIIVLCLICIIPNDENTDWVWTKGEEFTIATAVVALFFTLHFLLLQFSGCHHPGHVYDCKCHLMAGGAYALILIMWFISAGVETWMTTRYLDWNRMTRFRMRASATAFCFLEGLLYLASLALARFREV